MHQRILIFDFGSQYTQLIARRLRELNVYCEIVPFYTAVDWTKEKVQGVILSGSPASVNDKNAPDLDINSIPADIPILGICYGAQLMVHKLGGKIEPSIAREYGAAELHINIEGGLLNKVKNNSKVWMSHGDSIYNVPDEVRILASTDSIPCAVFEVKSKNWQAIQFHPEVYHTKYGKQVLENFLYQTCGCLGDWTPAHFVDETVEKLKVKLGNDKVILGLSGGVDSSVAAILLQQAIGTNLHCIFVNNGLLRKDEYEQVLEQYKQLDLNIKGVDASELFYEALKDLTDPETKRKAIGRVFVEVFQAEAEKVDNAKWLGQGTIYPDVIESVSVNGPSQTIKSHHNVGGLPKDMKLKVVEPLRELFKDEVRRVGKSLDMPTNILARHPFPGPGLGIRILGDITKEKVQMLQDADAIFINLLKENGLYDKIWQAGAMLLPVKSVGVMGDERTYEKVVALRAVSSTDGMTADWYPIPYDVLGKISNQIINKVKGINRVVYDISSKPPATIEWE